jgi:hypothetical protein
MHSRLIVLVDRNGNESSLDARKRAEAKLIEEGFAGEGSLFVSHPADWFVIGGRWSGELSRARLDQEKLKAFWEEFEKQELGWVGRDKPEEEQKAKAIELFGQFFPDFQGEPPVWRDSYAYLGFEDDAQVLDEALFSFIKELKSYPDDASLEDLLDGNCFVDLDDPFEQLTEDAIGKKWCVVVDFHY